MEIVVGSYRFNRKITLSFLSILCALTLLGAATYADFAVQVSVPGSVLSAKDESIAIAPDDNGRPGEWGTSIPGFQGQGLSIGDAGAKSFTFYLKNKGSEAQAISVQLTNVSGSGVGEGEGYLENDLIVVVKCSDFETKESVGEAGQYFYKWKNQATFTNSKLEAGHIAQCIFLGGLNPGTDLSTVPDAGQTLSFDALFGF